MKQNQPTIIEIIQNKLAIKQFILQNFNLLQLRLQHSHHQGLPTAQNPLTLSHQPSLSFCWLATISVSKCWSPQENVAYECIFISPTVPLLFLLGCLVRWEDLFKKQAASLYNSHLAFSPNVLLHGYSRYICKKRHLHSLHQ